ncbi:COX11 (YPL132W) [Zygosaccharomyces parabailii]|nr:COX11 (YPL132W) [Zygosaccharomyces parabailii]CDH08746.1 related to Cytochrome c oxidase assembly protein COX11, mitochondrial [Zygosaccharomyces bailii ISA1307]
MNFVTTKFGIRLTTRLPRPLIARRYKIDVTKLNLTRDQMVQLRNMKRLQESKFRNRTVAFYFSSVAVLFLGLAYAAVPLYRAICARTGFGGVPITDKRKFTSDKVVPVDTEKRIRVAFTSEVSQILPWKFVPEQREVYVQPGETALAFYKAKNTGDTDIIGMATYSITPGDAAQYFNKIQCFCFEEQRLAAGEEVDMPVFFFIDPDFASDPAMRNIDDIMLHYTFFRAHYDKQPVNATNGSPADNAKQSNDDRQADNDGKPKAGTELK